MPDEMLAFGAGALGVAMVVLLLARSYWVQRRVRAGPLRRMPTAIVVGAEADSVPKAEEVRGSAPSHVSQRDISQQRNALVAGLPGLSGAFRHPARGTAVNDTMNRALTIHYFDMLKGAGAPAPAK